MNKVPLNLYRIFYYVAINKNITRASKVLYISQPAITQSIKKLEEILNIQLIVRKKTGIQLTNKGEVLFNYIKNGMESFINGEERILELSSKEYGTIRIGASYSITKFFILPLIEKFHKKYPNIKIEITNSNTIDLIHYLKTNAIDIVVLNLPESNDNELEYVKKVQVQDCFVASSKYFSHLKNTELHLNELNKYPLILKTQKSNTRKFLDLYCATNNILLHPKYEVTSHWLLSDFVKIGYGIGHVTKEFVEKEIASGELFEINVTPKIKNRYVGFAILKGTPYTEHLNNFINLLN